MKYQFVIVSILFVACTKPVAVVAPSPTPEPIKYGETVISIADTDLVCKTDSDCNRIKTHCGCSYGMPVNTTSYDTYEA